MKMRKFGRVLFNSSRAALGTPTRTAYGASKAGMIGMARTWALELAPHGITVNVVAPGPIQTDNFWSIVPKDSEREAALAQRIPVGRLGIVEDGAHAFMFFADPAAGFVTGQTLYVCGGASIGSVPIKPGPRYRGRSPQRAAGQTSSQSCEGEKSGIPQFGTLRLESIGAHLGHCHLRRL